MNRKILSIGLVLMVAACSSPRHDEWCYGHTLKHCEPAVYFAFNSDKLNSQSMQKLTWVVDKMKRWSDRTVTLTGYTDLSGNMDYNKFLSLRRAEVVKAYLVSEGVPANRIKILAKGQENPLSKEELNQSLNRRVDITFGHKDH